MNSQDFVVSEFEKRGIDYSVYTNSCTSEDDFDQGWLETEEQDISELERIAQAKAEKDAQNMGVPFRRWTWPKNRKDLIQQFSHKYSTYISSESVCSDSKAEELLGELLDLLGQLSTYIIYMRISAQPVYRVGDEEVITQDAHADVMVTLRNDRDLQTHREDPISYYLQIYKFKTMDYLDTYGLLKRKKQKDEDANAPKRKGGYKSAINSAASIEDLTTNQDDETALDRMLELSENPFEDDSSYFADASRNILKMYLEELMENSNIPPAPLAVMYARVLYQMERLLDPETVDTMVAEYLAKKGWNNNPSSDNYDIHLAAKATKEVQKYTTATAPDWAIARMGTMTVSELGEDSELVLHRLFDDGLLWGDSFTEQLSVVPDKFKPKTWGAIVYTECYQKGQIENWAADIHNSTVIKAARRICTDPTLLEYVLDELSDKGRLKREVQKRQDKVGKAGVARK